MLITKETEILTPGQNKIELILARESDVLMTSSSLIIGVFHGDEPEGEYLVHNLINDIRSGQVLLDSRAVLLVPCLNPDGKALGTRENINKIDLNRDFPTKNQLKTPHCPQPETLFVTDILKKYQPDRVLTIHAPYRVVNYDGPAERIAMTISGLNGYPVSSDIGYPTPGSFGTYAGIERNIPVITLELPEVGTREEFWAENRSALHYFISNF